jgi:hypothetical protein
MQGPRGKRDETRADPSSPSAPECGPGGFDRGYEAHRRRQARLGLGLTPVERLRWLEETMEELRGLVGRARMGKPNSTDRDPEGPGPRPE